MKNNSWRDALYTIGIYFYNLLIVYVVFMICRLVFVWKNLSYFPELTSSRLWEMCVAGLKFDASAIAYANALVTVCLLFPLHWKEKAVYHQVVKWIFVIFNTLCVVMNFMDTVYFAYSNRRTTCSVFSQFSQEQNLGGIFGIELLKHWYLVVLTVLLAWGMYKLYRKPKLTVGRNLKSYYTVYGLFFLFVIPFNVGLMRGGFTTAIHPITISNANQYVDRPIETSIVLNTPFSMFRTVSKKPFVVPQYFTDREEMLSYFNPVHMSSDSIAGQRKNVVILILESFGTEYFGIFNKDLDGGKYKGYTPFLDSLVQESLIFEQSFANGRGSIDGMPSVLSSIPKAVESFFLTPASLNDITSVAGELRKDGYYTAFFHGAFNGSMGFMAFARTAGFQDYFGRTEYNNDKDFDGHWAIWDEEFLQYYANEMSKMKEPFCTSVFTASSHHPFRLPDRYDGVFPEGPKPIHRTIAYADHAVRRFFETASRQPWFKNTIFVLTADHTNAPSYDVYNTEVGTFRVPVIFYTPDGSLKGVRPGIAQQIDIMPTVLNYVGYKKPYVAFGCDLFSTPPEETFAFNDVAGVYHYYKGDYVIQFDGEKVTGVYAYKTDRLLKENLVGKVDVRRLELELKSFLQQYMERMNSNNLLYQPR